MKTAAVRIHRHGGPEVLDVEDVELLPPADGEVQIAQSAIGLNFADIYPGAYAARRRICKVAAPPALQS